ncbi:MULTISPECIES: hypothetical protein [unclassified Sphingobium]|uniref:hypothetical protein n=1 Tax=unclassified Sphingobium TaxID=2611147 RepID=UPI0022257AA4|nr:MULTISPECIES: hypothetical protein [unclassified Sphingobium]MCW2412947.1 hypothetical protein [Sphingobium sp. B8D3D]MCW2414755.1 hypothetical protein [Sphingobium sp. B8D3A]
MLIRLDEKVSTILKNQEQHRGEIKDLSYRVRTLEDWRTEMRGGAKGIGAAGKLLLTLAGALVGILGYIGVQFAIVSKEAPAKSNAAVEHAVPKARPGNFRTTRSTFDNYLTRS